MIRELASPSATRAAGAALGHALLAGKDRGPWLVGLAGELGAGKTTFVAGLLQSLGHAGPVRSPTYTFIEPYELGGRSIVHSDLYRIMDAAQVEELGLRDMLVDGAILLVEWPSRAEDRLGTFDLVVELEYASAGVDERRAFLRAYTGRGRTLVAALSR